MQRELPGKITMALSENDLVTHVQAGGGGFGDPLQRAPERVARDVWNGKISAAYAAREHGVVVDAASGVLDVAATERLRSSVASKS